MTLRDLLGSLRKHAVIVVAVTLLGAIGTGVLSMLSAPVYRASASLYFSLGVGQSASDLNQGATYTQAQMQSFAQLASMPVVLDPVVSSLSLETTALRLSRTISVSRPQDTSILEIAASSGNAGDAAAIANAVADELKGVVEELALRDANGRSTVVVRVVKDALPPAYPIAPNTKRNVAGGLAAGLLLGMLAAYLRDALDTRVRRPADVALVADVPVLGHVSRAPARKRAERVTALSPEQAEEFRRLRTNLQFLDVDGDGLCLVLSSAMPGEGKSTVSVNLAVALAEADMSVLLIDADMRRPRIADYLGIEGAAGLTTVLIGRASVEDVIQPWSDQRIDVLASGQVPPNPSELIATRTLRGLIEAMRAQYDVVLIDAPPLLPVADAAVLSQMASGVVLVADTRRLRRPQLHEVVDGVTAAGGTVLGVVLNRVKQRTGSAYGYTSQEARDDKRRGRGRGRVKGAAVPDGRWARAEKSGAAHVAGRGPAATSATPTQRAAEPVLPMPLVIPIEPVGSVRGAASARAGAVIAAEPAAITEPLRTTPSGSLPVAPDLAADEASPNEPSPNEAAPKEAAPKEPGVEVEARGGAE